ncbi:MAG TPA: trypsin-like serine protease [Myxococcota bacterium]|nr:trypsin-like serine protease [Myxococcota bacterium]HRY94763.1 trypsin-like serine protease [Myxococcota bacterium]
MRRLGTWIAPLCLVGVGCGEPPELTGSGRLGQAIIYGSPDTDPAHRAVVAVLSPRGLCSGTLITQGAVLTAAHCLGAPAGELEVVFGDTFRSSERVGVRASAAHPDYDAERALHDIGVLLLDGAPPEDAVPIPALPAYLGLDDADLGQPIEFVGFGTTEAGSVGRKLRVVGTLDWLCQAPWCDYGQGRVAMQDTLCTDQQPGGPCSGDSGGPGLMAREGRTYVAGVTAYGIDDTCLTFGCSTRVDRHYAFLEVAVGGAAGASCAADGECLSGECLAGLCCNAVCDGPCRSCALPGREGQCSTLENGAPCSDGDVCNGEEDLCLRGECTPGATLECPDDGDPCTADVCDHGLGCVHRTRPDGEECGQGRQCQDGACVSPPPDQGGGGCGASGRGRPGGLCALGALGWLAWLGLRRSPRRGGRGGACLGLLLATLLSAAAARADEPPAPDLARALPLLEQELDLSLLSAGQPQDRWRRAQALAQGLPPLAALDPLADSEALVRWLGALALVEGAAADEVAAGRAPPGAWCLELAGRYRALLTQEPRLRARAEELAGLGALQGEGGAALDGYAAALLALSAHARGGLRWLDAHRPAEQEPTELARELGLGLAEAVRREGDWTGLLARGRALAPDPAGAVCEAEALFELDRPREAEAALARARAAGASPAELARAEARRALAPARAVARRKPSGAAEAELARWLLALGEPWRLLARLDAGRVRALANPALDELYLTALGAEGRPLAERWAFAVAARGRPPGPAFLARRVGLGLRSVLAGGSGPPAADTLAALRRDLAAYRALDAERADATLLELELVAALLGGQLGVPALREAAQAHLRAHPADPAGLKVAFLLRAATGEGERPWELVRRLRKALFPAPLPPGVWPLVAASAVRELLEGGAGAPLEALELLRPAPGAVVAPELELWLAHLHAALGLAAAGQGEGAPHLQAAVDSYTRVLQAPEPEAATRCDAATSLASLVLEQGLPDGARELLARTTACHQEPEALAVLLIAELARGAEPEQGAPDPAGLLAQVAPGLGSRQAMLQAHAWLALTAEAGGDSARATAERERAAGIYQEERARGRAPFLALDRRALLAPWVQLQLSAEPDPAGPFGLVLEARLSTRLVLFPPAALDEARLGVGSGPARGSVK